MKTQSLILISTWSLLACSSLMAEANEQYAEALSQRLTIVDTHIDTPIRLHYRSADITRRSELGEFDYERASEGGLDAAFMSIFIPATVDREGEAFSFGNNLIDSVEKWSDEHPDKFQIATCTNDIEKIKNTTAIALPLGMENGGPIAGSLENLKHFYDRGIRYITLTHSKWNHISDSSYDTDEHWGGLSEFGLELITAMNKQGIMVDVSHITDRAFWQVIKQTKAPIMASHSSLRHFIPGFHRNMSDDMVKAIGKNGGVVQINFGSSFVTQAARDFINDSSQAVKTFREENGLANTDPKVQAFREQYIKEKKFPYATISDVVDHIDRVVALAGIDHVGLGSDFDGVGPTLPIDLKHAGHYPNLVAELINRDYNEADINKIVGQNLMRVWKEVELYASNHGNPAVCKQTE